MAMSKTEIDLHVLNCRCATLEQAIENLLAPAIAGKYPIAAVLQKLDGYDMPPIPFPGAPPELSDMLEDESRQAVRAALDYVIAVLKQN